MILRAFQVIITTNHVGMAEYLREKLCDFLNFIYIHQNDMKNPDITWGIIQDGYACMINTFNLLLDNRISAGISDFETPQNVLRYSGFSMKVLLAYSDFVDSLTEILAYNKKIEQEGFGDGKTLKYMAFVTAGPAARICATVRLSYSESYRFININIPVDLMFDVGNVLPWITHEVGHFIRAGWNREERNWAYFCSVGRGVLNLLVPFVNFQSDTPAYEEIGKEGWSMFNVSEHGSKNRGLKFDDYREYVRQFFQAVIYRYTIDYSLGFKIPYNKGQDLFGGLDEIVRGLQRIYEESIADMFMLRVLGIEKLNDYLKIQEAYFRLLHIDIENLKQENVSRIMAISVILSGVAPDDYREIKTHFHAAYDMCSEGEILPMLKKLREYKNYYLLEPLVQFLATHVGKGLDELLKKREVADILKRIRDNYSNLKKGGFEECLAFVLHYNKGQQREEGRE